MNQYFVRLLLILVLLNWTQFMISQTKVDFISLNYSSIGKSDFKDQVVAMSLQHLDVNCMTPTIKLGNKTKMNNIFYYRNTNYDFTEFPVGDVNLPTSFQEIKYTLFTRHAFNEHWELLLIPRITIRSDFEAQLTHNDLFPAVAGVIMKTSQKNNQFKWGIGVGYNNDLGKNSVIPLFALNYTSESMRLNTFFPNNANLTFISAKKIEYGFGFATDAALIHVNTMDSISYLRTLNVHVNPTFSYNVASNFWLNLKAGMVMRRNYVLYNADFEIPSDDFENKLKPAGFVQLGLSLRTKS